MRFLIGFAVLCGIGVAMYWIETPIPVRLYTGAKDCSEAINRIWEKGRNYRPTAAEMHDLDICDSP